MNGTKIYNPGSWSGKPYNFFGDYLYDRYRCRVFKLSIDAGLSCPNRDGTTGSDGCIFCSEEGSASPTIKGFETIAGQMTNAVNSLRRSFPDSLYIAYFQAFSNTYAPADLLRKLYDEAVSYPGITGLMIGTRPDCIGNEVLELIRSYKRENFELWLELGVQSMKDSSLDFLKRGHSVKQCTDAIRLAAVYDIPVCAHLIIGIPGETWQDMMDTATMISSLPVQGVKIHHLHIIKGTGLEKIYNSSHFSLMTLKEYISTLCDFLERLRPDIIIHRLMGDRHENSLVAPAWGVHKGTVQQGIDDEFKRRGTHQGFLCDGDYIL